jgi:CheY-like chemotaxis protein
MSTLQEQIRVLHVDSEPDLATLTAAFLERENERLTVETATTAEEGVALIDEFRPDCIVSDYDIPGMDGLEFFRVVREEYPETPFILYTDRDSTAVASDALAAGVTGSLRKGTDSEQYERLASQICDAVRSRQEGRGLTHSRACDE